MTARVLALAMTYNGGRYLEPLLRSLAAVRAPAFDSAIIDNGSTCETTRAVLRAVEAQGAARVIRHAENHGFARGYNLVLRDLVATSAYPYVFIVNDDVEVEPDALMPLLAYLETHADVFCVGPTVTPIGDRGQVTTVGNRMSVLNGRQRDIWRGETVDSVRCRAPFAVDYVPGCAMLVDVAKLSRVGLFDEELYHYFEDAELCFRARRLGYRCVAVPQAVVAHHGGGSVAELARGALAYYFTRNRFLFVRRYGWPALSLLTFFLTPRLLLRVAADPGARALYRQGLRDGFAGRGGPYRPVAGTA